MKWLVITTTLALGCGGGGSTGPAVCGDNILIDDVEECDDGNTVDLDGCSSDCLIEDNSCGNGGIDLGEQCDDGNTLPGDGCSASCTIESCGNAILDVGEQCDDGNNVDGDGCASDCTTNPRVTARWRFHKVGSTIENGCPTGFDTAMVVNTPLINGIPNGPSVIDLFDCNPLVGSTAPLPPDQYRTEVRITNTDNSLVYAVALSQELDLRVTDQVYDAEILDDGGYFRIAWNLRDSANNLLGCAQVPNLDTIELLATLAGPNTVTTDAFPCDVGFGLTSGIVAGTYTLSLAALDAQQQALGPPQTLVNKTIEVQNRTTALGVVNLPID